MPNTDVRSVGFRVSKDPQVDIQVALALSRIQPSVQLDLTAAYPGLP